MAHRLHRGRASLVLPALLCALGASSPVAAQKGPSLPRLDTGLAVEHFVPGIGPGAFLGLDGAGPPAERAAFALSLSHATRPLTVRNRLSGELIATPVRSLLTLDVGAEATLLPRLSVGVGLPVALAMSGDRLGGLGLGDEAPLSGSALGDLRARLRVLLLHVPRFSTSALLLATLPLGGEDRFFATSGPTVEPRLVAEWRPQRFLRVGGDLGLRFSPTRQLFDVTWAHELHAGLALDGHLPFRGIERLHLLVEAILTRPVGGSANGWAEVRGGLRLLALRGLSVDVAAGGGFPSGMGTPVPRVLMTARLEL